MAFGAFYTATETVARPGGHPAIGFTRCLCKGSGGEARCARLLPSTTRRSAWPPAKYNLALRLASCQVQLGAPPGSMPSASWRSDPPSKLHCWVGLSCRNAEPCGFTFYTATETVARPGGTVLLGGSQARLLPSTTRRSARLHAKCKLAVRPVRVRC